MAERGTRFTRAFSNGPGTRFAFKALNAGTYPLRIRGSGLPARSGVKLAEHLSEQGYRTAGFVDNPFLTRYFNHHRGFSTFFDAKSWDEEMDASTDLLSQLNRFTSTVSETLPEGLIHSALKKVYERFVQSVESRGSHLGVQTADHVVVSECLEWYERNASDGKPLFMWVHLMDAHAPYRYYPDHRSALGIAPDVDHVRLPPEKINSGEMAPQSVIDTYDANIREADRQVGRILEVVPCDSTVILTADHGEEFGLHDEFHQASCYENMARVPLIMDVPDLAIGTVERAVSHVDLPATIASIVGDGSPSTWDGRDVRGSDGGDDTVYLGFENDEGVFGGVVSYPWKYLVWQRSLTGSPRDKHLFDIESDPDEQTDVSETEKPKVEELAAAWDRHTTDLSGSRLFAEHDIWRFDADLGETVTGDHQDGVVDENVEEQLGFLGYK